MNQFSWLRAILNIWVWIGAFIIAGILLGTIGFLIYVFHPTRNTIAAQSTPVLTVIAAPTFTPVLAAPTLAETLTVTPSALGTSQPGGPIKVGIYVQIIGTSGDGLRIRSGPGTENSTIFIGMDSEVFLVQDGPVQNDNLTWWLLVAPYDKNRTGWAAGSYLGVVKAP